MDTGNYEYVQSDLDFMNNFKSWLYKNELKIEDVTALKLISSKNKDEGRCIISTRNYESDELIYKFPFKFLINYRHSLKHPVFIEFYEWALINSKDYRLTRMDALYLYLISQYFNLESELNGYVISMPRTYDTPEYFNEALIELLPLNLKTDILKRLKKLRRKYSGIKNLLVQYAQSKNNNITGLFRTVVDEFNEDTFRWIFNSVNSRCFHLNEMDLCSASELALSNRLFGRLSKKKVERITSYKDFERHLDNEEEYNNNLCCLIPYVDMLNHSLKPNATLYYDPIEKCYAMKASKKYNDGSEGLIRINQQVYINYGAHDNRTLLIEYGFSLGNDNCYDKLVLKEQDIADLVTDKALLSSVWLLANKHYLLQDLSLFIQGPSWCVLKLLDLICQKNLANNHKGSKQIDCYQIISDPSEIRNLFLQLLLNLKNSFQTSLDLLTAAKTKESPEHVNILSKFIHSQMSLIQKNTLIANDLKKWLELF